MKKQAFFLFFILIQLGNLQCFGQNAADTTRTLRIETTDGNIFVGIVVSEDALVLRLKTENLGEIWIQQKDIKSKTELRDLKKVGREFWLPNPQATRYYWAPNGYGLDQGTGYYQNIWVLYNQISVGVTDHFSIGAGMMPLFLFAGSPTPLWIVPKFSIPIVENKVNLGVGAFLGTMMGEGDSFGLFYGTSTFGSRDKNVSFGIAYGSAGGAWMNDPLINVSCMFRTGPRGYFISENYYLTIDGEPFALFSFGGRSIIRNIGLDYSLWVPFGTGSFVAMPFLGVSVPLGRKK